MTERLYQADSYIREFEAVVADVLPDQGAIVLDRTAFYPGGGGQPADLGHAVWACCQSSEGRGGQDPALFWKGALPRPATSFRASSTGSVDTSS